MDSNQITVHRRPGIGRRVVDRVPSRYGVIPREGARSAIPYPRQRPRSRSRRIAWDEPAEPVLSAHRVSRG